jgi:hypothetical protein
MKVTTLTEYLNYKKYNNLRDKLIEKTDINVFDKLNLKLKEQGNWVRCFDGLSDDVKSQIKKQLIDDYIKVLSINKAEKKELINGCFDIISIENLNLKSLENIEKIDIRIKVTLAKIIFGMMEKNNVNEEDYENMFNILSAVLFYPLEMEQKEPNCRRKRKSELLGTYEQ